MHGKFGLLSQVKACSHSTALPSCIPLCAVLSCFHTFSCEAYPFTRGRYRIFNARKKMGACRTHEGESDTNTFAQEWTQKARNNCSSRCPTRGSNPGRIFGFEFRRWNHWANYNPRSLQRIVILNSFCFCLVGKRYKIDIWSDDGSICKDDLRSWHYYYVRQEK